MKRNLPQYTHKQELWNSITHLVGVAFSLVVLSIVIYLSNKYLLSFRYTYPFYIYFLSMFVVFSISTIYHASPLNSRLRQVFRIIDHSDIYLFVAGTYTPICVCAISDHMISISLLIIEYALALAGILVTVFGLNNKKLELVGYIIYLIEGWALMFFYPFNQCLDFNIFIYILAGGIVYTAGAIAYGIGKKNIWFHTIFHIFIVLAAVIQFIGIYNIF